MQSDARSVTLENIRKATRAEGASGDAAAEWAAIPREYRRSSAMGSLDRQHLLTDRLRDYDAQVLVSSEGNLTETIQRALSARRVSRILVPPGLRPSILPEGFNYILASGLTLAEMNLCDGVLTASTLAIAETGTIVLQNVPGQGSRASTLLPDYHLCLVDASRIVSTVPEAIAELQATATLPTTFISGPSATADIEMTRIKGVHGPRFLDVILVAG